MLICKEVLTRGKNIRSKPPSRWIRLRQAVPFEDPREKLLRQVLRLMVRFAAASNEGVNREPIEPAQIGQCLSRAGFVGLAHRLNQAPTGCRESAIFSHWASISSISD